MKNAVIDLLENNGFVQMNRLPFDDNLENRRWWVQLSTPDASWALGILVVFSDEYHDTTFAPLNPPHITAELVRCKVQDDGTVSELCQCLQGDKGTPIGCAIPLPLLNAVMAYMPHLMPATNNTPLEKDGRRCHVTKSMEDWLVSRHTRYLGRWYYDGSTKFSTYKEATKFQTAWLNGEHS